jgi:hypothetical protein
MSFIGLWYHLDGLPQQVYLLGALILWGAEVRINSNICEKMEQNADFDLSDLLAWLSMFTVILLAVELRPRPKLFRATLRGLR